MTQDNSHASTTGNQEKPAAARRSPARRIGLIIVIIVLVVGAVVAGRWVVWRFGHAVTDAAYVKADMANVAPHVAGKIVSVEVREGETVQEGQVLFQVDPSEYDNKMAEAEVGLDSARAARERAAHGLELARREIPAAIRAARAAGEAARTQVEKAAANRERWEKQYRRFQALLAEKAIGRARFEEVETAWKAATADEGAARAQLGLAQARLAQAEAGRFRIEQAKAALAEAGQGIREAEERLRLARLARSWCDVRAPIAGQVAKVLVEPGDFATPARPAVGLYDPATRYVEARFEETKIRFLKPGKRVDLTVDSLPGKKITGHVFLVAPASAAEFALIPRDVTAGEFTKVTQRVPVKIRVDDLEDYPGLVPGLSVEVAVSKRRG